jgi:hypothetical protein
LNPQQNWITQVQLRLREPVEWMQSRRFAAKHAVASAFLVAGIVTLTASVYVALLMWAAVTGGGLGGPLTLPFLLLFAFVGSVVSAAFILMPTTAFTEWVCKKRHLPLALQIPVSIACLAASLLAGAPLIAMIRNASVSFALTRAGIVFLLLLIPLGVYWWSMQSADWVLRRLGQWWSGRSH